MADNKKYFWLKLKKDFFASRQMKKLRKIAGGETFTIIYLKMQLLSLQDEGMLYSEGVEDEFFEELALDLDEEPENVKVTMMFLEKSGLLEWKDENSLLLTEVPFSIGKEGASAERVRRLREKKKQESLQCNTDVTDCNTEIEIELEIEKDIDINTIPSTDVTGNTASDKPGKKSTKSDKPVKHKYGEYKHVMLTDKELEKLNSDFGVDRTKRAITYLDDYIEMKGCKYKNHNLVLRKWVYEAADRQYRQPGRYQSPVEKNRRDQPAEERKSYVFDPFNM